MVDTDRQINRIGQHGGFTFPGGSLAGLAITTRGHWSQRKEKATYLYRQANKHQDHQFPVVNRLPHISHREQIGSPSP